ncbi:bacterio-opsin activator [Halobiforma lacisalsi AJ5]|uniref:Bacterio-opsin activator n=1 Tax=Natronobacterium lacisalsi AJ5 TaxID=358396 RepID=M0LEM7_NATLA|nr:helix-turn-helix domain-containing protein [Halobiforma lacisalsi]APW99436.1 bacterio-opsin activator [Halobiforma lacisalsi AJ5]EMA31548.1 Bacterio-opsin activator HTH domain protein [Halobiforma lacisalsi AJ5]
MKRIQFSATYPERLVHPLHQQIIGGTSITRAELLMWSPTRDATTLFWCDGGREAAETIIANIDSLLACNFVEDTHGTGTYAFLQQDEYEFSRALLDTIAGSRVIFLPPVAFLDTGEVRFEAVGEPTALSTFHDELSELANLSIERVHEFERKGSPSRLTDRQESALETAAAVGYYEVPREGTVADVAAVLDCSKSTAGELVRKAEATVIRDYLETRCRTSTT